MKCFASTNRCDESGVKQTALKRLQKTAKEIAIELSVPQLPKLPLSYLLLLPDLGGKSDETNRSKSIQT